MPVIRQNVTCELNIILEDEYKKCLKKCPDNWNHNAESVGVYFEREKLN